MASVSFNDWVLFMGGAKSEKSTDSGDRSLNSEPDLNNRLTSTFVSLSGKGTKYFPLYLLPTTYFTGLKMSKYFLRQVE